MSQTAGFKQDSYDVAYMYTRHMNDEFIKLITYALAKNQYTAYGCYGPEIRQYMHVFTASMTIYGLVDFTETNSDANEFKLMLGLI